MLTASNTNIEWFAYFDISPDLVCIASKDGYFKKVNASVVQKLGYSETELFSRPISSFIHPDDKEKTSHTRAKMINGEPLVGFENRYLTKSGNHIWLHWTSIYLSDKEIVFAIARDITTKKKAELEVIDKYRKFESLASHFKTSVEKNREYFAYELQEQLAQLAAVIKMDLDMIASNPEGLNESSKKRIDHAVTVSDLLLKTIQRISFSISPKMLQDFGLYATLEWLCKEYAILNNISCRFENSYPEEKLTKEIKSDFFRICQEALTNVTEHSGATEVNIAITHKNGIAILTVTDNGKGFDINDHKEGFGLTNMSEIARSINGKLEIDTVVGRGTVVKVEVPV